MKNTKTLLPMLVLLALSTNVLATNVKETEVKPASTTAAPLISFFPESELQSRYASWGIDPDNKNASINLKSSWFQFKKNKEVVVAVIDTGIDNTHPFLQKNIYVPQGAVSATNFGMDFSVAKPTGTPIDGHGHGTHVSGIVKSIFPDVKLLSLKYYNPQASGADNLNSTIKALEFAVDQNVDVINYSGGGPEPAVEELRILKLAERKGIIVVAAAGNEKSDIDDKKNAYYPASYGLSNIITVSAHDESNETIASSNWGKRSVDVAAPGHRIRSAIPNGSAGYMTGTSQATAFVTGVVALMKSQFPELTAEEVKSIIISSSKKEKTLVGKCVAEGRLDATNALSTAKTTIENKFAKTRNVAQSK